MVHHKGKTKGLSFCFKNLYNNSGDKMNKEIKRQLILTMILLCLLVSTLFLWYGNFHFHTYMNAVDYQYCFAGKNDDLMIDGYEFYKQDRIQKNGQARLLALKNQFFLKDDQIKAAFIMENENEDYQFEQTIQVQHDNEVCHLNLIDTNVAITDQNLNNAKLHIEVIRDEKTVYDQDIPMINQNLVIYNGSNKDYAIQNVRVTSTWLKTGQLSTKDKDIAKQYPNIVMDYMYLKDDGNENEINDYERFVYIKGKTEDILSKNLDQVVYYDGAGSLLDKQLLCVVTLSKDEKSDPYIFMINLHGTIKAVETL